MGIKYQSINYQAAITVDTTISTRPQRKKATKQYLEKYISRKNKLLWTAEYKDSWRKMEVAAECRQEWFVGCGLFSTGSDKA